MFTSCHHRCRWACLAEDVACYDAAADGGVVLGRSCYCLLDVAGAEDCSAAERIESSEVAGNRMLAFASLVFDQSM